MSIPAIEDVQDILDEFQDRLRGVVDRGWSEWIDCELRPRLIFKRSGSNNVFDFIARHALEEFGSDPDVHVISKGGTFQFLFCNQVLVRFKKSNSKGVGSNIETQATLDFVDPNRDIPGMLPDIMKVEVCYLPDVLGTGLQEVAVVARNRTSRVWSYALEPATVAEIVTLQPDLPEGTTPIVITPKKSSDEAADDVEE